MSVVGLFDPEKELARLAKQKGKLEKDLEGLVNRLSNAKFMAKASSKTPQLFAALCQPQTDSIGALGFTYSCLSVETFANRMARVGLGWLGRWNY